MRKEKQIDEGEGKRQKELENREERQIEKENNGRVQRIRIEDNECSERKGFLL